MPSEMELSLRRRMVYHGIRSFLPDQTARWAVKILDAEFQNENTFSVVSFLNRLTELDRKLRDEQSQLHRAITTYFGQAADAIGPDPIAAVNPLTETPPPTTNAVSGWHSVFNVFINHLVSSTRQIKPKAIEEMLKSLGKAKISGLSASTAADLTIFSQTCRPNFRVSATRQELHCIFHSVYLFYCEEFGPVLTDKFVQRAIRGTQHLPESLQFPMNGLL
ncbi:MAG: hypothetical protein ACRC8S_12535 [Fimbriiglobus sp.]